MLRVRDYSIPKKLTWMNLLVSGAALGIACAAFVTYDLISVRETMVRHLSIQSRIVGSNSVSAILFNDPRAAETTLNGLKSAPNVLDAAIYTKENQKFAEYRRDAGGPSLPLSAPGDSSGSNFDWLRRGQIIVVNPISFQGNEVGTVYIRSDLGELTDRLKKYLIIVCVVFSTSLIASVLVSSVIRRLIAQPIVQLADTARIISHEKNYSLRAREPESHDELAILVRTFNQMLGQIQESDAALREAHDELETRVQQRTAQLRDANKQLQAFSYSIAHDLRGPLRAISGYSKLLVEDYGPRLDEQAHRYLNNIARGVKTMGDLINDLLEFSRQTLKELAMTKLDMNELVKSCFDELMRGAPERKPSVKFHPMPSVLGDRAMIRQVWMNLLSNALKFTANKSNPSIEVGCLGESNGRNTYYVRDNGAGFDMRYVEKLFGIFQRLHSKEEFQGTGVGLSIAHRVIERHGGRIWAEGKIDEGATFYFALPAVMEELEAQPAQMAARAGV